MTIAPLITDHGSAALISISRNTIVHCWHNRTGRWPGSQRPTGLGSALQRDAGTYLTRRIAYAASHGASSNAARSWRESSAPLFLSEVASIAQAVAVMLLAGGTPPRRDFTW